jgi:ABC-type branched-subunit amino acid transport system ATPase component
LGVIVFVTLVISLIFRAFATYAQLKFTLLSEYSISSRLIEGYLHQPYTWFLHKNSAELGKTILSEVSQLTYNAILPMLVLISQGIVVITIILLLIFVDPKLSLIIGLVLTISYWLIYRIMGEYLSKIGNERFEANKLRFSTVSEAFGAVKEVKVRGLEKIYTTRFKIPAKIYADNQATAQAVSQIPRFILEGLVFGGLLSMVLYLITQKGNFANALPILALYAFAGYKLLPAMQQVYGSLTQLKFSSTALESLYLDLNGLNSINNTIETNNKIIFNNHITINNISYTYPSTKQPALSNLSLLIKANTTVGLVGTTGSGKTTLVDVILGLLEPEKGYIKVDDLQISETNRRSWHRAIGYVPQFIYLIDDTIASNIAFGEDPKKIDYQTIERVAKIANLHEFVINELPLAYKTIVGERGVRLSGGQRQRIGIARALYHNPKILILDEATSALDNLTEQAVMDAVNNLGNKITIILIAHRLTTVKKCDKIYLLKKGNLLASGTYEELSESNEIFKAMIKS